MTTVYRTIKKSDAGFQSYLSGQADQNARAVPIKSYNLGTAEETVTFELRPMSEIHNPSFIKLYAALFKLRSFVLVLFPFFFVLAQNYSSEHFDFISAVLSVWASLTLFAGLNVRNDVLDHYNGYDRVNIDLSDKPIRQGWVTAHQALRISTGLIFISFVMALPVFLLNPSVVFVAVIAAGLFTAGRFLKKDSYKNQFFGELVLTILMGPLLYAGFQLAMGVALQTEVTVFSLIWGWATLFLLHVNNFVHIMTSSQNKIKNAMTYLGFDKAQKFLVLHWTLLNAFLAAFLFYFSSTVFAATAIAVMLVASAYLFFRILRIKSPMGSGLIRIKRQSYRTFSLFVLIMFLECVISLRAA